MNIFEKVNGSVLGFCGKMESVEKGASNTDSDLTKSNN